MSAACPPAIAKSARLADFFRNYAELAKLRVTSLIIMTAWCGYFLGARQESVPTLSWGLFNALVGIGLVSSGTAALNEVLEVDVDRKMRRTAARPLPSGRMGFAHACFVGLALTIGGSAYLWILTNPLTGTLAFITSLFYLAAYTPLKRRSTLCTLVGAFPGAMPGVLGWAAVSGRLTFEALVLFTILFCWQFPHFFSIAWLYREDYANGGIQMLPVVEPDGQSTARQILIYSLLLIPVSLLPALIRMAGLAYAVGALVLGLGLLYFSAQLANCGLPANSPASKSTARALLRASVLYLPLLFAIMMASAHHG